MIFKTNGFIKLCDIFLMTGNKNLH